MKKKKIPLRKCLGCNEMKSKKELLRVVYNYEKGISVDTNGKAQGRGAYVCHSEKCFKKAKETKALNRAFKTNIPEKIYEDLMKELNIDESKS